MNRKIKETAIIFCINKESTPGNERYLFMNPAYEIMAYMTSELLNIITNTHTYNFYFRSYYSLIFDNFLPSFLQFSRFFLSFHRKQRNNVTRTRWEVTMHERK